MYNRLVKFTLARNSSELIVDVAIATLAGVPNVRVGLHHNHSIALGYQRYQGQLLYPTHVL